MGAVEAAQCQPGRWAAQISGGGGRSSAKGTEVHLKTKEGRPVGPPDPPGPSAGAREVRDNDHSCGSQWLWGAHVHWGDCTPSSSP